MFWVIVMLAEAVHPLVAVPTTEYVPAAVTVMLGVVAPVLHRYVFAPLAVSTIDVVVQFNTVDGLVITTLGTAPDCVIVILAVEVQPFGAVTVTV